MSLVEYRNLVDKVGKDSTEQKDLIGSNLGRWWARRLISLHDLEGSARCRCETILSRSERMRW